MYLRLFVMRLASIKSVFMGYIHASTSWLYSHCPLFPIKKIPMSIFTEIERLIDEGGSSTILKDRILLLMEKHAVFVNENIAHKTKIAELGTQVRQLKSEITKLQEINEKLKFDIIQLTEKIDSFYNSGTTDHVCDHCGSRRLKRTGNRPNKRFGKLGVKDTLFQCEDCGKETAIMIVPSR
jgi:hypothetical protein